MSLFSHKSINAGGLLVGTPDFLLARRSPLGNVVLDTPLLITVEAKRDDFENAWGQCLAQMKALYEINKKAGFSMPIYGIVSNGVAWQFAQLKENIFTQNIDIYTLTDLGKLFSAIEEVFHQCKKSLG